MAVVAVVITVTGVQAQTVENLSVARTYGAGVHAYFSGAYDRSYDDLTAVIEAGSNDPRPLYFRGLAALKMGRLDEAEADFSSAAQVEAQTLGNWPVSKSLERVQGRDRLQLERHRVRARVAALQEDRAAAGKRYSGIEAAQPDVLRRRRPASDRPVDRGNPFADDAGSPPRAEAPEPQTTPEPEPAPEPEPMPEPAAEPAAPGDTLEPEPEPKPAASGDEPADAGGTAPEVMEREEPAAPGEAADAPAEPADAPAEPAAPAEPEMPAETGTPEAPAKPVEGGEDPFGDNAPAPTAPMAEEGEAPAQPSGQ